jgi:hypothetical protein
MKESYVVTPAPVADLASRGFVRTEWRRSCLIHRAKAVASSACGSADSSWVLLLARGSFFWSDDRLLLINPVWPVHEWRTHVTYWHQSLGEYNIPAPKRGTLGLGDCWGCE